MKKKLKDITVGEIQKECQTHKDCSECPFKGEFGCKVFVFPTCQENIEFELTEDEQ